MSEDRIWQVRDEILTPGKPNLVMGIVNVTPDSFSDGGRYLDPASAIAHGLELVRQGAAILDIGGESSRPGSKPISAEEEAGRVVPVIQGLSQRTQVPLSVDTCKADVARQALLAGASIVNDITALQGDSDMPEVVRTFRAGVILMHMQGTPATMQDNPVYADVVAEVVEFLEARLQAMDDLGIARTQVVLDPGIGFGKRSQHNLDLLAHLDRLGKLGRPVCLGVSRKGFLGRMLNRNVEERLPSSLAVVCHALAQGSAQIFRVHDVGSTADVVAVFAALSDREQKL